MTVLINRFSASLVFLVSISTVSATTMYKWVDENGEVHFSQTPPINSAEPDVSYEKKSRMAN